MGLSLNSQTSDKAQLGEFDWRRVVTGPRSETNEKFGTPSNPPPLDHIRVRKHPIDDCFRHPDEARDRIHLGPCRPINTLSHLPIVSLEVDMWVSTDNSGGLRMSIPTGYRSDELTPCTV